MSAGAAAGERRVVVAVGLGVSVVPLDAAVNVAFPAITAAFATPVASIRWVIICYVLTYASLLLAFGRLADVLGHRRIFVFGLLWSTGAFALCALAPSFGWLLAARVVQGVGAAAVLAAGPALATLSVPVAQRGRAVARYVLAFSLAGLAGPLVAGVLVEHRGWAAVFGFRVPIAVVAAALVMLWVPAPAPTARGRFDPRAGIALALALAAGLLALSQGGHLGWWSAPTLGLGLVAAGALLAFTRLQHDPRRRVIDLALFRRPAFAAVNLAHLLANAAGFMVLLLVPYYLVHSLEAGMAMSGLLLALSPLGVALASGVAAPLTARHGPARLAFTGLVITALGLAAIAMWPARAALPLVALALLAQGFGYGLFQVATMDFVMGSLGREHQGVAGSLNMVTRTIGVVGGASAATLLFDALRGPEAPLAGPAFLTAFSAVFWCAVAITALGAGSLRWVRASRPR